MYCVWVLQCSLPNAIFMLSFFFSWPSASAICPKLLNFESRAASRSTRRAAFYPPSSAWLACSGGATTLRRHQSRSRWPNSALVRVFVVVVDTPRLLPFCRRGVCVCVCVHAGVGRGGGERSRGKGGGVWWWEGGEREEGVLRSSDNFDLDRPSVADSDVPPRRCAVCCCCLGGISSFTLRRRISTLARRSACKSSAI